MSEDREPQGELVELPQHRILLFEEVFSPEECERLVETGRALEGAGILLPGVVDTGRGDDIRDVDVAFVMPDEASRWVFERLAEVLAQANKDAFRFDLEGFGQGFQVSRYAAGQHYGWHLDIGPGPGARRKLSITLQLSDPSDYEGGDLEFRVPDMAASRARGSMTIFPSWTVHRVSPVTRGERWSLVSWISGPRFR